MKNSKKRVRLLLVMGVVFSNGVVLAPLGETARTESVIVDPVIAKKPVEPRDVFLNQLHNHLMVHKDPKEQNFRPVFSTSGEGSENPTKADPALNSTAIEATPEDSLSPEQKKALDKLNKPRSFLNGRLLTGKKGVQKQVELTKEQDEFIEKLIRKLLVNPAYKVTKEDIKNFSSPEDLKLIEQIVNTVRDYIADVNNFYKVVIPKEASKKLKSEQEYERELEIELMSKTDAIFKKLGTKYSSIFHIIKKVVEADSDLVESFKTEKRMEKVASDSIRSYVKEIETRESQISEKQNKLAKIENNKQDAQSRAAVERLKKELVELDEALAENKKFLAKYTGYLAEVLAKQAEIEAEFKSIWAQI